MGMRLLAIPAKKMVLSHRAGKKEEACMSEWVDWFSDQLTQQAIDEFSRAWHAKHTVRATTNYLTQNTALGGLGELTFEKILTQAGLTKNKHFHKVEEKSQADYIIHTHPELHIDVKTLVTKSYPKDDYSAEVAKKQLMNPGVNMYAFCYFVRTTNTVVLLGIMAKHTFQKNAIELTKGIMRGKFTVKEDVMQVQIKELSTIESLLKWVIPNLKIPLDKQQ